MRGSVPTDSVSASRELQLRTRAWYGDREVSLPVPSSWDVAIFTPTTGTALTDAQIMQRLESPVDQPPVRVLARGKVRPLLIVDDLNRPTPASRIVPALLRQLEDAGIPSSAVGIVMAPGTHGPPAPDALIKKVGAEAAASCRLYVHDCRRDVVKIGKTSFGTPVFVNKHVLDSDFLIGVGGLYPNQTAGFGGGSKLALGVLGFRTIAGLHYGHQSMGWGTPNNRSNFRRDIDEIAKLIGLSTSVSLILNGDRDVVEVACGQSSAYYEDLVKVAQNGFQAPLPDSADVVISNAYPNDLSLTFVRMKGIAPLTSASLGASRIVIASCSEGLGFHGLFPFMNAPRHHRQRMRALRFRVLASNPISFAGEVRRRLKKQAPKSFRNPIWVYRADALNAPELPKDVPGMRVTSSWDEIIEAVRCEQGGREVLKARVYSCAALQWLG